MPILHLPGIEPQFICCLSRSLVSILTSLCRLIMVRDVVVRNDHMCNKFRYKPSDDVSCIGIAFISDTMTVSPYSDVL